MTDHPWRVGLWCAVSSRPQADPEKESLPAQERAGRDFARAIGGQVVAVYVVPGHSRDYVFWQEAEKEMPAYLQVREDLEAGKLDVIHCTDSDRLGRDPALVQQFYSLAERHGCEVFDSSMPHPLGQAHLGHRYGIAIKGVAAGEDQRRRVARHASGIRGRVKRGLPPLGRWPTGYSPVFDERGRCIGADFDAEIETIARITRLFLEGRSYSQILAVLPSSWSYSRLRRTVYNDGYAGYFHWSGTRTESPSDRYPALWDAATYAAILRERARRMAHYTPPGGGPLNGIAYCWRCGWSMTRVERVSRPGEYYVRCGKRAKGLGCHPNTIPELSVLVTLSDWLEALVTPARLEAVLVSVAGLEKLEQEHRYLRASIEDSERRRHRLALALAAGQMDPAIYYETDQQIVLSCAEHQKRLDELHTLIVSRPSQEERRAHLEEVIAFRLENLTDPVALGALRRAGVRVYCEERKVLHIGLAM